MRSSSSVPRWPTASRRGPRPHGRRGPERRSEAVAPLITTLMTDPASISGKASDDIIAEMQPSLRSSEDAQRPAEVCFRYGPGGFIPASHMRQRRGRWPGWIVLKSRRSLDRGRVEPVLNDIEILLRLARDLRPAVPLSASSSFPRSRRCAPLTSLLHCWPAQRSATSTRKGS